MRTGGEGRGGEGKPNNLNYTGFVMKWYVLHGNKKKIIVTNICKYKSIKKKFLL
jgi:hypothetical protein